MKNPIQKNVLIRHFLLLLIIMIASPILKSQVRIQEGQLLHDLQILASDSMQGRKTGTAGGEKARRYIIKRFGKVGLKPYQDSFEHPFSIEVGNPQKSLQGVNVLGYINGASDKILLISAHYDHEGIKNGNIYNGADDNASGVSALFGIAQYFTNNPPRHTMLFAAFDAEELGLLGAKAFVTDEIVPLNNIKININMDMISRNDNHEIYVAGTYHYPQFISIVNSVDINSPVDILLGHDNPALKDDWTFSSDHGPLHSKKIPFLYFGVEDHEDYHTPTDDVENIDMEFYHQVVEMIMKIIIELDRKLK